MTVGPKACLAMLSFAVLSVTGCVIQQQQPPVASQIPASNAERLVEKTAIAGQTIKIDFAYQLNPDCTVRGIPTVIINGQPAHGTARVTETDDFTSYPPQNRRF